MDPVVESALISAVATVVGVGGAVAVAIVGFRISRSTNQATIDAAHVDVQSTLDNTRDGQIADRYTRAIDQLGSHSIDVTIGGIYALERIAHDSLGDHPTVMEVLTAFVREHSHDPWPPPDPGDQGHERSIRPDIQTALTVVGRRDAKRDIRPIDLTRADLTGADLTGADLTGANLINAKFVGALFSLATLAHADLTGADLTDATLTDADRRRPVNLGANLDEANLTGAILTRADLAGATLTYADLTDADLTDAFLYSAKLTGAKLTSAKLTDANLIDADLTDADLTAANLDGARLPVWMAVPEGWHRDIDSGRVKRAGTDSGDAAPN